jgi:hypothetical protein
MHDIWPKKLGEREILPKNLVSVASWQIFA